MNSKNIAVEPPVSQLNEAEKRLLDAALHLFSEKGYEATSIREIIERAGVTRPVLYYYFVNKEDLFKRLVDATFSEIAADFARVLMNVTGSRERLKVLVTHAFEHAEHSPASIRLILQVFFSPPNQGPKLDKDELWAMRFDPILEIMREGVKNSELRGGDPETLALSLCGVMDMHIMCKANRPATRLTADLAEGLVDLFFAGAVEPSAAPRKLTSPFDWSKPNHHE
jgi:TetR/AcrR family transcriptional regulator